MKVLLTSGTGYIGAAVARALTRTSHDVGAIARSDSSALKLKEAGVTAVRGDISDHESIADIATRYDAVVHTAFSYTDDRAGIESRLASALVKKLANSNKNLIYTSGVWVYGASTSSQAITEEAILIPASLVAWRPAVESIYLAAAAVGINTAVVRPAMVYGETRGIIGDMFKYAAKHEVVRYVGTGTNHWSLIHVDDLATLYTKVLQKAPPGSVYNASAGEPMSVHDIATVVADKAGISSRVKSWPLDEAQKVLGDYAEALTRTVVVSSARAQRDLQWKPVAPSLVQAYQQQRLTAAAV